MITLFTTIPYDYYSYDYSSFTIFYYDSYCCFTFVYYYSYCCFMIWRVFIRWKVTLALLLFGLEDSLGPGALLFGAVPESQDSFPVLLPVLPSPGVNPAVRPAEYPEPVFFVLPVLALVLASIGPVEHPFSIHFVIFP